MMSAAKTNSTLGAQIEMLTGNTPDLPGTSRQTWSVTKTLMTTSCGAQRPITETCGFRTRRGRTGLLTTTGIGLTSSLGAIPGWMMSRGVLLRFTMAAGFVWVARGAGSQHRRGQKEWSTFGPYTPRRWLPGSAVDTAEALASRGFHWDRAKSTFLPIPSATTT